MTIYSRIEEGSDRRCALLETEGERGLRGRGMTGGVRMVVREGRRRAGLGWFGGELGRLAPGCGPSGLLALPFIFFLSVFLFFCF
jgi:hypothetical protein